MATVGQHRRRNEGAAAPALRVNSIAVSSAFVGDQTIYLPLAGSITSRTAARRPRRGWLQEMAAGAFGIGALDDAAAVHPDAPVSNAPGLDCHRGAEPHAGCEFPAGVVESGGDRGPPLDGDGGAPALVEVADGVSSPP